MGTSGCGKFAHSNLGFVVRIDRDWARLDGLTGWLAWRCALTKFDASIGRQTWPGSTMLALNGEGPVRPLQLKRALQSSAHFDSYSDGCLSY
jgi:hypothetical protein